MLKGKLKKTAVIMLSAAMLMALAPAAAFADEAPAAGNTGNGTQTEEPAQPTTPKNEWNESHTEYYGKDGKLVNGLTTIDGEKYYFENHKLQTGVQKIDGKLYYFGGKSGAQVTKKGLYDNKYYIGEGGALQTGYIAQGSKAWYFSPKNGAMKKGGKVKYLKIPKSGNLGSAYANGIRVLNKNGWTLRKAYTYSYKLHYANRWMRKKNSEAYANVGFTTGTGNCYVMAATFYIQGKLLGYDIHQVRGHVGAAPHSWTIIRQNGRSWVYDPNFRNETGRNGWKIYYGKSGTWRYGGAHLMN